VNPASTLVANPFPGLGRKEKKRLALAALGVVGLSLIAWYVARKPAVIFTEKKDYGIDVNELCVNAVVTDSEKLRRGLEDTYDTQVDAGITDPLVMSTAFFAKIAPHCHVYPREPRSPKEAEFFLTVFMSFLEQLEIDNLIVDDEARAKMFEAMAWASRGGWKPTQQIGPLFPEEG
jgi:hypothetical protein